VLNALHRASSRRALLDQRPGDLLFAAAIDLQAFGLLNQALGPRLANLVIDLVTASLTKALSALSEPLWTLSFGDEHYYFSRVAASEAERLATAFESTIADAAHALDDTFVPMHVAWTGAVLDRQLLLPKDAHDLLGHHRVLASAVPNGTRFEALARLAGDRDVHRHAGAVQGACQGLLALAAHDLYRIAKRSGRWRLPFPRLRLALGLATAAAGTPDEEHSLDFVLQELHRTIEQARGDGIPTIRRDFVLGQPAFRDGTPRRTVDEISKVPSIRTLEKDIAGGLAGFDRWQIMQLKPRWTLPAMPDGRHMPNSLKELVCVTNPGFADRLLGAEQIALADLAAKLGHACGASGNNLLLAIPDKPLTRRQSEQLLEHFQASCPLPGGAQVSRVDALTVEGYGPSMLLRAIAAVQNDLSTITGVRTNRSSTLLSFSEDDLAGLEGLMDEARIPALERYEALREAVSSVPVSAVRTAPSAPST
jgi:hypothetical protein